MSRAEVRQALQEATRQNLLERAIAYVAPTIAARRQKSRMFMALSGAYTGASRSRRQTSEWKVTQGNSADADTLGEIPTLRDRSRDAIRNEPLAAGAIAGTVTSVVGTGLAMHPRIDHEALGMTEAEAEAWQKSTAREWNLWAESTFCDATRTQNFYGLQDLVFRSALESGDVFALSPMRKVAAFPYELALQVIEGDQVSNPKGAMDTEECAGGVQVDEWRAPKTVHVRRSHPGALNKVSSEWDPVPVFGEKTGRRQVLHLYDRLRPGQRRGVPWLSPVIETLKMLGKYTEAELMAAVVSGMFTVFVESSRGGIDINDPSGIGGEVGASGSDKDIKLAPGAIVDLAAGEKVNFADPSRPNQAFDGFCQALATYVGVALEIPREVLLKHFTASYSASRAALLEAWKFYKKRRAWLVDMFCDPVYELWMDEAVAKGRVYAPGYFSDPVRRRAYLGCEWVGDGPISLDPVKDVEAAKGRVELGTSTLQKESMALDGSNWEQNHAQRVREVKARRGAGLEGAAAAPAPAPSAKSSTGNGRDTDLEKPETAN